MPIKPTQSNLKNKAIVDAWAARVWPSGNDPIKSPACSFVLRAMDEDYYFTLSYEQIVEIASTVFGVTKNSLNKELDIYV